ncbi:low temperature requirement protein A [Streptomyces mirabilis]|uniref:low temperature requirement protein A n=1 Tax=Streptomyces mirabilis TaxID=68239 RepID=UPI0036AF8870
MAQTSTSLHGALTEGNYATGVLRFALVFFTVGWAWMNFTWFASAYDSDDVPYRLTALAQITGSLVLATGVRRAFEDGDLHVITLGYVLLRTAPAALWRQCTVGTHPVHCRSTQALRLEIAWRRSSRGAQGGRTFASRRNPTRTADRFIGSAWAR